LVALGLATESGEGDPPLSYLGSIEGPGTSPQPSIKRYTAVTALADSGLLIAAVNRGDRHHAWATRHILGARQRRVKIVVPDVVVGEAFTKLRYDRRVSPPKAQALR